MQNKKCIEKKLAWTEEMQHRVHWWKAQPGKGWSCLGGWIQPCSIWGCSEMHQGAAFTV